MLTLSEYRVTGRVQTNTSELVQAPAETYVTFRVDRQLVRSFDDLARRRERSRSAELRLAMAERLREAQEGNREQEGNRDDAA